MKSTANPSQLLAEARAYIRLHAPYYMHVVYNFVPYWDESEPGVSITAGMVLTINPKFWQKLPSVKMRAGLLVRNAHHILRGMERFESLAAIHEGLAAIASEIPINDSLLVNKDHSGKPYWELPPLSVTSSMFGLRKGETREYYFAELRRLCLQNNIRLDDDGTIHLPAGLTSSVGSTGPRRRLSPKMAAEHSKRARPPSEVARVRREGIKQLQRRHADSSHRGTLPGGIEELLDWTEAEEEPVVPWETYLSTSLHAKVGRARRGSSDYSKRRLSKRSFVYGWPQPGLVTREPCILFVEDSSGSMGPDQLITSRTEIMSAMRRLGISRAWFMDADAAAQSVRMVDVNDIPGLPITGRGGTNFAPAFEAARQLRPRPRVVIYLTDGDGYAPPTPPTEFDVIFCIVPSPWQKIPALWGTTIILSNDPEVRQAYRWVPPPQVEILHKAPEHEVDEDGTIVTTADPVEDDGEDGEDFTPPDDANFEEFDA